MADETDKVGKKQQRRLENPSAPGKPGLPVPGPGRPKGSPDGPKSKRVQKARVAKMLSYLDQMAKLRGGDVAQWLDGLCSRDPEFERWLAETYVRSNMPDAMDPDVKEVAMSQAAAAGQEGGKGSATVNLIMGVAGEYARGITAPAVSQEELPVIEAKVLPAGEPESDPMRETKPEDGQWES